MSAVFGYGKIKDITIVDGGYHYDLVDDTTPMEIGFTSKQSIPIGTEMYWEYNCKTGEIFLDLALKTQ